MKIQTSRKDSAGLSLYLALGRGTLCLLLLQSLGPFLSAGGKKEIQEGSSPAEFRKTEYWIRARVPILGDIGRVGTFVIAESTRRNGDKLEKVFRMSGQTKPELVKKGHDYGGEFEVIKRLPLDSEGRLDEKAVEEWRGVESFYSGFLKKKGVVEGERVVFYPDYAVATRENGAEKRVEGSYGSLLAALEYFLDHDVKVGDVYKARFILDGYPYIFKCEVSESKRLAAYNASAFRIDVTTYDAVLKDRRGIPLVRKKKGGIRLWLSKDGKYRNTVLLMRIHYKWYLTLSMEMNKIGKS